MPAEPVDAWPNKALTFFRDTISPWPANCNLGVNSTGCTARSLHDRPNWGGQRWKENSREIRNRYPDHRSGHDGVAGQAAASDLYEERLARAQERLILTAPIAEIEISLWYDHRIDITEAQKELRADLSRASDLYNLRDA